MNENPSPYAPKTPENESESAHFSQSESHRVQTDLSGVYAQLKSELGKVIVGQTAFIDLLLVGLICKGHVLIEGVPGVAKTLTAKLLAKTLSVGFSRIQFTPDLMPADILGTSVFNVQKQVFEFHKGPIFSNMILIDEINRAPAKTQAALFEVMEEQQITIDGTQYKMEAPFMVLATQNPIEQEGTYRLPEAQLDRFLFKIVVDYPSLQEEIEVLTRRQEWKKSSPLSRISELFDAAAIQAFQEKATAVVVENKVLEYIANLVQKTRNNPWLYLGASPRASLAILDSAKAWAAIQGRDFVIPEDVQKVATPVLQHRIVASAEKEMEGVSVAQIVEQIMRETELTR